METLLSTAPTYTVVERANRIYNGVLDIFDYNASNDVTTPLDLARDQVRQIPTRSGNVLIPGAGIGTYALACLLEGFAPNQITAVELNRSYSRLGFGVFSRFGVNYVQADYLSWNPDMKFDVIIGNPPYQDDSNAAKNNKLWMKFIHKSLELLNDDGFLGFVTPRSFVGRTQQPAKIRNILSTECSLLEVNHDADAYFKVGVDICYWLAQKTPYQGVTKVTENKKSYSINLLEDLPLTQSKKISDSIAEKIYEVVKKDSTLKLKTESNAEELPFDANGVHKVYTSGRNKFFTSNDTSSTHGKWKVAFSYSATYKGWFVTQNDVVGSNKIVYVDSPEDGVEIGNTLLNPIIAFYLDSWRKTAGYTPAVKNNDCLPDVRGMDTNQIKQLFNLTDEEYSYIECNHVPYKDVERVLNV
jgi:predicted RNA methylase